MKRINIDNANVDSLMIDEAASAILKGGIVAMPTETVYGLAVDPDKKESLKRLYELKQRPKEMPLSLALADKRAAVNSHFSVLPPFGYRLIEKFWPGPLTIIYFDKAENTIGVRVPSDPVANKILAKLAKAVFLTSANLSGSKDAVSGAEVENIFDGKLDLIVDSGNTTYGKSSTIIDLTLHPFKILRNGVISEQEIVDTFIKKRILFVCTGNSCRSPMAQFLLEKYLNEAKPYLHGRHDIISRGISTFNGMPASTHTSDILKEKEGLDIAGFTSRRIDRETILSSDLIFTMEDAHADYILKFEPTAEGRVFALKKFLPKELENDIPDPIGKDVSVYNEVYSLIKKAIIELTGWL